MKIMIEDDYYIDENGNKYYNDNITKEKCEKNNVVQQSVIDVDEVISSNSSNYSNDDNDEYSYYGYNCSCEDKVKGSIIVHSRLGCKDGVELKGAKINLYVLNGVSPKLFSSKVTDAEGKVIFDNLDNGCYRVIAILDRKYFEKPCYITWNEVTIDSCCKEASIIVVNKIKDGCLRR